MIRRFAPIVCGTLMLASTAGAQIGHLPAQSPYHDLEYKQELTLIGGSFLAHRDPANAAPQSGALIGARYAWRAAGPANLTAEISRIQSDRQLINPFVVGPGRDIGTTSRPLYSANLGLALNVTGAKSWHNIVPEVAAGLGVISDLRSKADSGGFKFGTRFAINWGGGIRWVPTGGRWQVRGDITNRLYTISYPEAFYLVPTGAPAGSAVLAPQQARSFWTNNPAFTLGISRLF
ncbi:MAG TPA: hypothetical protein VIP11_19790 [Gemmatimonadaceae bacterium]